MLLCIYALTSSLSLLNAAADNHNHKEKFSKSPSTLGLWGVPEGKPSGAIEEVQMIEEEMNNLARNRNFKELARVLIEEYINEYSSVFKGDLNSTSAEKREFANPWKIVRSLNFLDQYQDLEGKSVLDYIKMHKDNIKVLGYLTNTVAIGHGDDKNQWISTLRDHMNSEDKLADNLTADIYEMVNLTKGLEAPSRDGEFNPLRKLDNLNVYSRGSADKILDLRIKNLENVKQILEENPQLRAREYIIRKSPETKINLINLVGWNAELDKILFGRLRNVYGKMVSMIPQYNFPDSRQVESKINKAGDLGAAVYYILLLKTKKGSVADLTKNAQMSELMHKYRKLSSEGKEFLRRIDLYEEKQKFGDSFAANSSNSSR